MPYPEGLDLYQLGKETVRGTLVAATSKAAVQRIDFEPTDRFDRPALAKGLLHRHPGSETVIVRGTRVTIPETSLVYDQHHHWLTAGVKGGVTATGIDPYTWTFARSLTADPAPDTWTLERRATDGTTPIDEEWGYFFVTQYKWIYRADQPLRFALQGFARRVQGSTLTAALALPTIEIPASPLCKIWIDSTWANLGTTQIVSQVIRADVTFNTGLQPFHSFDGRTDLDFTAYEFNADACGLDVELEAKVGAQRATEKTAAEAGTLRAMRLQVLGTQTREFTLDMLLKHDLATAFKHGVTDGQEAVTWKLVDSDDGTNMFSAKVVNKTNALT